MRADSTKDGAAMIFACHLMPRRGSNPRQASSTRLGPLKGALQTELQRRGLSDDNQSLTRHVVDEDDAGSLRRRIFERDVELVDDALKRRPVRHDRRLVLVRVEQGQRGAVLVPVVEHLIYI